MIPFITAHMEKLFSHIPATYPLFQWYYREVVEREILLGKISKQDRVLCIGGGAYPVTAIEMNRQSGARVDVLDCDEDATVHAQELLREMGTQDQVRVMTGCGRTFDTASYTVVHLALQVYGREAILENVLAHADSQQRILLRLPRRGLERFYQHSCSGKLLHQSLAAPLVSCQPGRAMKETWMIQKTQSIGS